MSAPASTKEPERVSLSETLRLLARASRGFWAVNLINFGDGICYFGILNLLVLFLQQDVGMATESTHVAVSTFTGIVTVGMFLGAGQVCDWLGVRRSLNLSLLLVLIGRVVLTLAPGLAGTSVATAWIALVVIALGEALIQPALYAGVKEYADERTATMGYALIYSVMNLGIVAESVVSPLIREWTRGQQGGAAAENAAGGITGVYWVLCGVTVLLLLSNLAIFTPKAEREGRNVPKADAAPPASEAGAPAKKQSIFERIPLLNPQFLFFIFILLPVRTLFAHQWLTIPEYVIRCFPEEVGKKYEWISALNPAVIVIGVPLIAALTRNVSIIKMMIIGTAISAASTFLLAGPPDLTMLLAYVVIFSIGEAVWSSRFLEYVAELAPAGKVGAYMGIATLPWFLAKSTTGWYSGFMLEAFIPKQGPQSSGTMWMIYGAIAMISPIGLVAARRWIEGRVSTPKGPAQSPLSA